MTYVRVAVALLVAYLVHLVGLALTPAFPALVDPFLVVVVWYALRINPVGAELIGTVTGLLQDALSGGLLGLHAFADTLVAYAVSLAAQRVVVGQQAVRVLIFAAAALVQQLVLVGLLASMLDQPPLPTVGGVIAKVVTSSLLGALFINMENRARTRWGAWQRRRSGRLRFR